MRRAALLVFAALALPACGGAQDPAAPPPPRADSGERTTPEPGGGAPERVQGTRARVETVATGLEAPWEVAFLPDGRALITERPGRLRLVSRAGRLRRQPLAEVEVSAIGEGGLLGVAVDPEFDDNGFVYLFRTVDDGNVVTRYRLEGERLEEQRTIVEGIEASSIHNGGRLRFGPDNRLYIGTGDAGEPDLAQDRGSLNGKILRMDADAYRGGGGRPEVFSLGHRNGQGFDWEPGSDRLVESEHGASGNDEVNVLRRGGNFGWPRVEGAESQPGLIAPVTVYENSIAPSGASFVTERGSAWTGDFLIGALAGEQIRRVRLDGGRVTLNEPLLEGDLGRVRTVVEGPDGAVYALTSNRDGRGSPREGDDRLVRIVPPAA